MYDGWHTDFDDAFARTHCAEAPLPIPAAVAMYRYCRLITEDVADKKDGRKNLGNATVCRAL
jgi:hypothetical protein